MHPTKKAGRIAGAIYASMVFVAPFSLIYAPNKLIVRGDATATAANVLNHESMFRLWIMGDLWMPVIFICLGVALYNLLSGVGKPWALLMLSFVLVSAVVGFLDTLNNIASATRSACSLSGCTARERLSTNCFGVCGSFRLAFSSIAPDFYRAGSESGS